MSSKEIILDFCKKKFLTQGCRFTLDEVVQELKISRKTIYKYYLGKEDILKHIIDETCNEIHEKQQIIFDDASLSDEEKLKQILTVKFEGSDGLTNSTFKELEEYYPSVYEYTIRQYEAEWDNVHILLERGMNEGRYRKQNIFIVEQLLQQSMQMITKENFLECAGCCYQEALEESINVIWHGIFTR